MQRHHDTPVTNGAKKKLQAVWAEEMPGNNGKPDSILINNHYCEDTDYATTY
jgi:hypothetical protein